MKTLLRDIQSGLYSRGRGKWTPDAARALDFKRINRAIKHAEKMRLGGVQLVVASANHRHLTALPVEILPAESLAREVARLTPAILIIRTSEAIKENSNPG